MINVNIIQSPDIKNTQTLMRTFQLELETKTSNIIQTSLSWKVLKTIVSEQEAIKVTVYTELLMPE